MTEANEVNINISFQASHGTWMTLAAAGAMMIVGILAAVTLGVGWMGTTFAGQDVSYSLSEVSAGGGSTAYDAEGAESFDGTGLILAGQILQIIGTVFAFVAMLVLATSLFLRTFRLTLVGSILAGVTGILLMVATILAPIGISQFHEDFGAAIGAFAGSNVGDLGVGAGLILAIIATVFTIAASVGGFMALRDPVVS